MHNPSDGFETDPGIFFLGRDQIVADSVVSDPTALALRAGCVVPDPSPLRRGRRITGTTLECSSDGEDDLAEQLAGEHRLEAGAGVAERVRRRDHRAVPVSTETHQPTSSSRVPVVEPTTDSRRKNTRLSSAGGRNRWSRRHDERAAWPQRLDGVDQVASPRLHHGVDPLREPRTGSKPGPRPALPPAPLLLGAARRPDRTPAAARARSGARHAAARALHEHGRAGRHARAGKHCGTR